MQAYIPKNINEVKEALSGMTERSKILGGGTDFIIRLNMRMESPDTLCYLGNIKEYKGISRQGNIVSIGAYTNMTEIAENEIIKEFFPALSDSAIDVGSLQIRNRATIGGNVGNASPAGDLIPVLYLYDAIVGIVSPEGEREISIKELIERPGKTCLKYNEAICFFKMKLPDFESAFVKLGTRKKVTISRIGVALGIKRENKRVKEAKIYIGAISIKPVVLEKAEDFLIGKELTDENVEIVAKFLSELILEITPKEFDRDYKIYAAKGVIEDVFKLLER